jgi:hypothetical protein
MLPTGMVEEAEKTLTQVFGYQSREYEFIGETSTVGPDPRLISKQWPITHGED